MINNKTRYKFSSLIYLAISCINLYIYSSFFNIFPWFESCGIQFLAIFITAGILLLFSLLYFIRRYKTHIPKYLYVFPSVSALLILLPILLDLSLNYYLILLGLIICFFIFLYSLYKFLSFLTDEIM